MSVDNFQEFIIELCNYWVGYGCIWSQPYDTKMGAGTFHPHTFLKAIGPEPWRSVYVQPCRRPVDGRYGKSPNRFQHYYQLQVLLKPSPSNIVDVFLKSLEKVGINLKENDIGLLEDDWKGPTLGAWGLGWEIRANGQEITQFTYFQQVGGIDIDVVCGEITYGLERLYMYAKNIKSALDIPFNNHFTYGDIFFQNEFEFSYFNFKYADIKDLLKHFENCEEKVNILCDKDLVLPAYDYVLEASHSFNLLDARGAISTSERQRYIGRVRECARKCANKYLSLREKANFPLLNRLDTDARNPIVLDSSLKEYVKPQLELKSSKIDTPIVSEDTKQTKISVLFELGVEEIPPSFQESALVEFNEKVLSFIEKEKDKFKDNSLFLSKLNEIYYEINASSRRLSLQFKNIPEYEPTRVIELWGPAERIAKTPDGNLSAAAIGFCKKNNIDTSLVTFKLRADGTFIYYAKEILGESFPSLLANEFKNWCYSLNSSTKMKWLPESISPSFIRPVRWIVALAENKILPLEMFGISSNKLTAGQRILHPEFVSIEHANEYENILKKLSVEISHTKRANLILTEAKKLAQEIGGNLLDDPELLNKCAGISENPYVFIAEFDKKYLKLPSHLISSVLKTHMYYFSVTEKNTNNLLPYYIGVANYKCVNTESMIEGTKAVVIARLEDGMFYFETDLKTSCAEFKERLKSQIYQKNMGTLFDKSERLKKLVSLLDENNTVNAKTLMVAAEYCKADLQTGCVLEFPDEMQGVMGGILIKEQNLLENQEQSNLASAMVTEHYLPTSVSSNLPSTYAGCILALADKIDSLSLMINAGIEVKTNKDPLGLRRLALGIARLLGAKKEKHSLSLSVQTVVKQSLLVIEQNGTRVHKDSEQKIIQIIVERIRTILKERYDPRSIDALSNILTDEPLYKGHNFAIAIEEALKLKGEGSLIDALIPYRRARNLTQDWNSTEVNPSLFTSNTEEDLFKCLINVEEHVHKLLQNGKFQELLLLLASLAKPMANFFENVMVNDSNNSLKQNRLSLLMRVRSLYDNVANFSLIQVQ